MKLLILLLAGFLILSAPLRAQETKTLVNNDQVKVELTTGLEHCPPGIGGAGFRSSSDPDAHPTCAVLSITNKSGAPITAWAIVFGTGLPTAPNRLHYVVTSRDSLPDLPRGLIPPGVADREAMLGATQADFKAAVLSDGSVFGEPEWIEQIVQNRRETYRDTIVALQELAKAKEAGTPREQLVREFRDLQHQETKQGHGSPRSLNSGLPPWVPKFHLFGDIAHELERQHEGSDDDTFPNDIDRLKSMMLEFGKRLLASKPPITDHFVEPGEPIEPGSAPQ